MSFTADRRSLICDGDGCTVTARLPVALRRVLMTDDHAPTAAGWLCVSRTHTRHFCPACAAEALRTLSTNETIEERITPNP